MFLELFAAGETVDELLSEYDELTRDDIFALEYAASVAGGAQVISFVA